MFRIIFAEPIDTYVSLSSYPLAEKTKKYSPGIKESSYFPLKSASVR